MEKKENLSKKIDLLSILKKCLLGIELWSPLCGKCYYNGYYESDKVLEDDDESEIHLVENPENIGKDFVGLLSLCRTGQYYFSKGECVLFPSEDQRDWTKFEIPSEPVNLEELQLEKDKEEERLRLLKEEISSRLPYGVLFDIKEEFISKKYSDCYFKAVSFSSVPGSWEIVCEVREIYDDTKFGELTISLDQINRLILRPLDSMTEQQKKEFSDLFSENFKIGGSELRIITESMSEINRFINWAYKNHLDINNLISKRIGCYYSRVV